MKFCTAILVAVFCLLAAIPSQAQRNLTPGVTDTENFDSLGTGNVSVSDNITVQGFYSERTTGEADPNLFTATANPGNTPGLYNFGSVAASDRTAGSLAGAATGTTYLGLRYVNTGSFPVASITVTYTGELWRDGNGVETLSFAYQSSASPLTSLTAGTWTAVPTLDFTQPTNPGGNGPRDGNAAVNRTTITASIQVNVPVGGELMLRWADASNGGQSSGLGIDDVSVSVISVTAREASVSGRVTTSRGTGLGGAVITIQGGDLAGPKTVATSRSGDFVLNGLTVGQTYFVSVNAKGYSFSEPVQMVNLTDHFEGLTFQGFAVKPNPVKPTPLKSSNTRSRKAQPFLY